MNKNIWEQSYEQHSEYYLRNSCSIVSFLNVLKHRYAIFVVPNFIIKLAIFFEKKKWWSSNGGGVFDIVHTGIVWGLNYKLGLKFKKSINQISTIGIEDKNTYSIGIKKYSTIKWNRVKEDGIINKEDIDYLLTWSGGIGHATNFDGDVGGKFIDSYPPYYTDMSLETLKYGESKGIFWDNMRSIEPADERTRKVCELTIRMFQAEKKGRLAQYLEINKENPYLEKAKELYLYGR